MNFSQMQHFQDILLKSLEEIQSQLKNLPKGKILCIKNGKYTKWFKSNHSKPIYIKKKNRKLAIGLAKRTYLTALSSELSAKLELVNSYIDGYNKIIPKSELLLIIPSINLITTYETKNIPLDSEQVNQIINYYFS